MIGAREEFRYRLETAIQIAENESVALDSSILKSPGARYALDKMGQQWGYVRGVLRDIRALETALREELDAARKALEEVARESPRKYGTTSASYARMFLDLPMSSDLTTPSGAK